ncbi:MAG: hypothetical protein JWL85_43 [Candidatus Saccharibacteria bacterium]|nr:hypothetical protein [Candidatus Saccharibacteria bacterium]
MSGNVFRDAIQEPSGQVIAALDKINWQQAIEIKEAM